MLLSLQTFQNIHTLILCHHPSKIVDIFTIECPGLYVQSSLLSWIAHLVVHAKLEWENVRSFCFARQLEGRCHIIQKRKLMTVVTFHIWLWVQCLSMNHPRAVLHGKLVLV